jgi:hypothetical protein
LLLGLAPSAISIAWGKFFVVDDPPHFAVDFVEACLVSVHIALAWGQR